MTCGPFDRVPGPVPALARSRGQRLPQLRHLELVGREQLHQGRRRGLRGLGVGRRRLRGHGVLLERAHRRQLRLQLPHELLQQVLVRVAERLRQRHGRAVVGAQERRLGPAEAPCFLVEANE